VSLEDQNEKLKNLTQKEFPLKKRLAELEMELNILKDEKVMIENLMKEIQIFIPPHFAGI
jgi:predicted nuclease with TOPRIM domain